MKTFPITTDIFRKKYTTVNCDMEYVTTQNDNEFSILVPYMSKKSV